MTHIFRFYPVKDHFQKRLSPMDAFYAYFYPRGGLYFHGNLDLERFIDALKQALVEFEFLFCRFYLCDSKREAIYQKDEESFLQLEVENSQQPTHFISVQETLPSQVDPQIKAGSITQLDHLAMGYLKLTLTSDGFILGYYFNNAFFDQASIVYFFKTLSHLYSYGSENYSIKKPHFYETQEEIIPFKQLSAFRHFGKAIGHDYVEDSSQLIALLSKPYEGQLVDVTIEHDSLQKFRYQVPTVSENDILHAVLQKAHALDPAFMHPEMHFVFPCNMRKRCKLGEESIGNIVSVHRISLPTTTLRQASLQELAKINREFMKGITQESFKNMHRWYRSFYEYKQSSQNYHFSPVVDPWARGVTNWASFNYHEIAFDQSTPISLKTVSHLFHRINVISFDVREGRKIIHTTIGIPKECVDTLIDLGKKEQLFTVI